MKWEEKTSEQSSSTGVFSDSGIFAKATAPRFYPVFYKEKPMDSGIIDRKTCFVFNLVSGQVGTYIVPRKKLFNRIEELQEELSEDFLYTSWEIMQIEGSQDPMGRVYSLKELIPGDMDKQEYNEILQEVSQLNILDFYNFADISAKDSDDDIDYTWDIIL